MNIESVKIAREAIARGAAQKEDELAMVVDFLLRRDVDRVLEIGSYMGGAFWAWCQLSFPSIGKCVAVDIGDCPFDQMMRYKEPCRVLAFKGDSKNPDTLKKVMGFCSEFDLLVIDGDHSYDGTMSDYQLYSPLVRPGGFILFHDISCICADEKFQVRRAWDDASRNKPRMEFHGRFEPRGPNGTDWAGIGLLVKD